MTDSKKPIVNRPKPTIKFAKVASKKSTVAKKKAAKPREPEPIEPPPAPKPIRSTNQTEPTEQTAQGFATIVRHDDEGETHGEAFIRLLNPFGLVRAVTAESVPDRLFDGYRFIVDEPCVPRERGDPERCDGEATLGFVLRPVFVRQPQTYMAAVKLWIDRMKEDRQRYSGRKDLIWGWVGRMESYLRKKADGEPDLVYSG